MGVPVPVSVSVVTLAAAAVSNLLRLRQKSGAPAEVIAHLEDSGEKITVTLPAALEDPALGEAMQQMISHLSFSQELPEGSVIEIPTQWPARVGADAVLLTKKDGQISATPSTFTAADDHALAVVVGDRAVVLAPEDPLAEMTRRQARSGDPLSAVDDAIARLRSISAGG